MWQLLPRNLLEHQPVLPARRGRAGASLQAGPRRLSRARGQPSPPQTPTLSSATWSEHWRDLRRQKGGRVGRVVQSRYKHSVSRPRCIRRCVCPCVLQTIESRSSGFVVYRSPSLPLLARRVLVCRTRRRLPAGRGRFRSAESRTSRALRAGGGVLLPGGRPRLCVSGSGSLFPARAVSASRGRPSQRTPETPRCSRPRPQPTPGFWRAQRFLQIGFNWGGWQRIDVSFIQESKHKRSLHLKEQLWICLFGAGREVLVLSGSDPAESSSA